ncbi:hypothetical protein IAT40_002569 [Kwoniella sp. CBS 6097]
MSLPILRNITSGGLGISNSNMGGGVASSSSRISTIARTKLAPAPGQSMRRAMSSSTPFVARSTTLPAPSARAPNHLRLQQQTRLAADLLYSTRTRTKSTKSPILCSLSRSSSSNRRFYSSSSSSSSSAAQDEPTPNTASGRLKAMFKKYGWYSLGMYLVLGFVDCGLVLLAVHTLGADKIEPVFDGVIGWYRTQRYGAEEAEKMKIESIERKAKEAEEAQRQKELNVAQGKSNEGKSGWNFKLSKTFWAELALAYAIHKTALLPVRAALTVAWTPKFVAWLTRRGWVGKGGLTRAANHAQDKVRTASDRVKERVKRQ